jgi:hypothetical protein
MKLVATALALFVSSSAFAASIGRDVEARAVRDGRARVIVTLREEAVASKSGGDRAVRIESVRSSVLSHLAPAQFAVSDTWSSVAGFAGDVTPEGLEALAANPLVDRVDLDVPGGGALSESITRCRTPARA